MEITELNQQLDATRDQLAEAERACDRDREDFQAQQERLRELELVAPGLRREQSKASAMGLKTTLGDELDDEVDGVGGRTETKTEYDDLSAMTQGCTDLSRSLRLRIRTLQRELEEARGDANGGHRVAALESILGESNKIRDRYQSDYLEAHRGSLKLQATLEYIRSGRGGDKCARMPKLLSPAYEMGGLALNRLLRFDTDWMRC